MIDKLIEKAAVEYAVDTKAKFLEIYPEAVRPNLYPQYDQDDLANAFKAGANYALCKQEKDVGTVISGWVARDTDTRNLYFYNRKPIRMSCMWSTSQGLLPLDPSLFPDLTWESDPLPVTITIKPKQI